MSLALKNRRFAALIGAHVMALALAATAAGQTARTDYDRAAYRARAQVYRDLGEVIYPERLSPAGMLLYGANRLPGPPWVQYDQVQWLQYYNARTVRRVHEPALHPTTYRVDTALVWDCSHRNSSGPCEGLGYRYVISVGRRTPVACTANWNGTLRDAICSPPVS